MKAILVVLATLGTLASTQGGAPTRGAVSEREITFHFERPGLPVPVYTLTVHEDGTGSYQAVSDAVPSSNRYSVTAAQRPGTMEQPLSLNPEETAKLFLWAQGAHYFEAGCASKAKGIADTGLKTLTYTGPNARGTCTYNFSENKNVVELATYLQAMAAALDLAQKLEAKHKFDRLGLDGVMSSLVDAVRDGRATGLSNIRPTLESLADDPQVLERVRNQARKLLEQSTLVR